MQGDVEEEIKQLMGSKRGIESTAMAFTTPGAKANINRFPLSGRAVGNHLSSQWQWKDQG